MDIQPPNGNDQQNQPQTDASTPPTSPAVPAQEPMNQPAPAPTSMPPEQQVAPQPQAESMAGGMNQSAQNPGKGLGVASLVLAFVPFAGLIGLILGIIGKKKSSAAGQKNGLAVAGIILGIMNLIGAALVVGMLVFGATTLVEKCNELGPGVHYVDGITYTCE